MLINIDINFQNSQNRDSGGMAVYKARERWGYEEMNKPF